MPVVQQPQTLGLQAMNDVLLAPQERMTMQTAVDGTTLQECCPWPWSLVVLKDKTGVLGPGLGIGVSPC